MLLQPAWLLGQPTTPPGLCPEGNGRFKAFAADPADQPVAPSRRPATHGSLSGPGDGRLWTLSQPWLGPGMDHPMPDALVRLAIRDTSAALAAGGQGAVATAAGLRTIQIGQGVEVDDAMCGRLDCRAFLQSTGCWPAAKQRLDALRPATPSRACQGWAWDQVVAAWFRLCAGVVAGGITRIDSGSRLVQPVVRTTAGAGRDPAAR